MKDEMQKKKDIIKNITTPVVVTIYNKIQEIAEKESDRLGYRVTKSDIARKAILDFLKNYK